MAGNGGKGETKWVAEKKNQVSPKKRRGTTDDGSTNRGKD